jgi:8-hydroxy-5-deazaflavin:NADPH oxidoreductase
MRIAVIGAGSVGTALAEAFAHAGHTVTVGTRNPAKAGATALAEASGGGIRVTGYREAVDSSELVVLAVPGRLVVEIVAGIGPDAFGGKLVIDPTNPVVVTDEGVTSAFAEDDSAAEALQRLLPDARVVKAFNQIEAANMLDRLPEEKRPMRIAGDDEAAKAIVAGLLEAFGWKIRDLGPLTRARALERGAVEWMAGQWRSGLEGE